MKIFPGETGPYLFAHRGYSSTAPENTLAAFQEALSRKIPGIELDIHLCRSGELVVTHDHNLERVTGFRGTIEDLGYSDIKHLDAGSWKDEKFSNERLPLLQDVFDLLGDRVYYDIEIKSRSRTSTGIENKLLNLLKSYRLEERTVVSSFNPIPLKNLKKTAPGIPTAIIYCNNEELPWYLRHGEGRWIASVDILKPEHVMIKKRTGKRPVFAWTTDDPAEAKRLLEAGVSGIISNDPAALNINNLS